MHLNKGGFAYDGFFPLFRCFTVFVLEPVAVFISQCNARQYLFILWKTNVFRQENLSSLLGKNIEKVLPFWINL